MGDLIDIAELIVSRFFALVWFCFAVFHAMHGQYDASIAFGVLALYARSLVKEERRG